MKLIIMSLLFLSITASAQQSALPEPPKGYSWQWCEDIKGAFLKPDGWFFRKDAKGGTLGIFITKEDIGKDGQFKTGLTVNVIRKVAEKKKIAASEYIRQLMDDARKSMKFIREWDRDMGPFKSVGFLYERQSKEGAFKVHNLLIANDKTGTVYLVMFEAPAEEWEAAWRIGEPIMKKLYIDDEI